MTRKYEYFEHISDAGFRAEGEDLDEMFECGAEAALAVMFELDTIEEKSSTSVEAEAPEIDLLFVEVINELLSIIGRDELALKRLQAEEIKKTDKGYSFRGLAHGERLDLDRHGVKIEVKGATYSRLAYECSNGVHAITCVLDV